MASESSKGRVAVLQVLRAIAALLVAQAHVVDVAALRHAQAAQVLFGHFENLGAVGVDIFFAISGFIVPLTAIHPAATRRNFLLRRAVRIYPVWWCALILYFLAFDRGTRHSFGEYGWSALLLPSLNPHYAPVIYLGWTLIFEMFFYVLIAVVWGKDPRSRLPRVLAALGILGAMGIIVHPVFPFSHLVTNPMLLEFGFGVLMGLLWTSQQPVPKIAGGLALIAGTAWLFLSGYLGFGNISQMSQIVSGDLSFYRVLQWGIPSALIVFGGLVLSPPCSSLPGTVLVQLGDASYSLYLSSLFTQSLVLRLWRYVAWMPGDIAIATGVVLMGAVGYGLYRIMEFPILQRLNRFFFGSKKAKAAKAALNTRFQRCRLTSALRAAAGLNSHQLLTDSPNRFSK